MSRVEHSGISVDVPSGWEVATSGGGFRVLADSAHEPTVMHLATFPLPGARSSFGTEAVQLMRSDDVFMVLFEYGPESADTPLFASQGIPRQLDPSSFDREALLRGIAGQSGLQHFFTHNGRAFCLYVVLGSHIDRSELVGRLNPVLQSMEIT